MSNQRYITFTFLGFAVVLGVTAHSATVEGFALAGWADPLFFNVLQLSILISIAIGIAGFFVLLRNRIAVTFTDEVVVELRKIFWPDKEETINSTTVVLAACFILACALAFFDLVWAKVTGLFLFGDEFLGQIADFFQSLVS
jgi:preprotein translocase subunit SecE